jgi:hypothetical protein
MLATIPPPTESPEPTEATRPRPAFVAAAATAVMAAAALSWDRPGIGWLVTMLAVAAAVVVAVRSSRRGADSARLWSGRAKLRAAWTVAAGMLIAVGTVRAAGWLFVLCILTAGLVTCVALTDRSTIDGLLLAPPQLAGSTPTALRWLISGGLPAQRRDRDTFARTLVAALTAVALLLVFGALLIGADAAFGHIMATLVPSWDIATLLRWLWSAAVAVTVTAVATHALLRGAATPETASRLTLVGRIELPLVRRHEWALPVGGLVALFTIFVAVQATVLFGGDRHVLDTAGLTYSQYARSGFWQLLAVTGLTVVVVAAAARIAPRTTAIDRMLLRTLLGLLSALTLTIVASALVRMADYEQAYGFTRRRLLVTVAELWLGALFLLILVAGIRLRGQWIPRAALATAVAALLGLAVLNPDAFVARQNVTRFDTTGRIDVYYLRTLSADAVPALQKLPEPYRSCALAGITERLTGARSDTWFEWNLDRQIARDQLHEHPAAPIICPPA